MKEKKLIRYRISISQKFPANHPKAGQETYFVPKIQANNILDEMCTVWEPKLHTIRGNYQLWKKRFEKIEKGDAVLELYYWTGKPYNSSCKTFATLTKEDRIGLQKIEFPRIDFEFPIINGWQGSFFTAENLAKNDGLSLDDFKEWFKGYDLSEPLAIIHFTKFRY